MPDVHRNDGFPPPRVTAIAAGSPGGGLDLTTRITNDGFEAAGIDTLMSIENMGGGGGNPARAAVLQRENDGTSVVFESNRIFLSNITGTTDMSLDDFTPLAQLTTDYEVWIVKSGSEYDSAEKVLDDIKEDAGSVNFGIGTVPSDDQLNVLRPASEYGVEDLSELNLVAFSDGGDLNNELLGGRIDVASTGMSEAMELVDSGHVEIIAVSSPEPVDSAPGAPTWHDLGLDITINHWRGVFGPKDMPQDAVDWWRESLKRAVETDEFAKQSESLGINPEYVAGEEWLDTVIRPEQEESTEVLQKVGLVK
ncbi:Bug family tripartite tricarboxylate transporter substrate binding protein [Brevibacterium sp. CFH 10365]|uniref:Bug family tripartite tricarboxylate transporter substrate binding protein n=1 Tax=Brevibacterium sp. CFH 10365 TaxID=2585207 RepID=UPI001879A684|nr:tripartite tricarboxylate transporter substrate-binding protein [Brevibacterium sp. CFH 10365]